MGAALSCELNANKPMATAGAAAAAAATAAAVGAVGAATFDLLAAFEIAAVVEFGAAAVVEFRAAAVIEFRAAAFGAVSALSSTSAFGAVLAGGAAALGVPLRAVELVVVAAARLLLLP